MQAGAGQGRPGRVGPGACVYALKSVRRMLLLLLLLLLLMMSLFIDLRLHVCALCAHCACVSVPNFRPLSVYFWRCVASKG